MISFDHKFRWKVFFIIFLTKSLRMFSYGMLSFILLDSLYLKGFSYVKTSFVQSATVVGDISLSLYLATKPDRFGRLNILLLASLLKIVTGLCYADSQNTAIIIFTGFFGIISVTGRQFGPFQSIERGILSELVEKGTVNKGQVQQKYAAVVRSYNTVGHISQGIGTAFAGIFVDYIVNQNNCSLEAASMKILRIYSILGAVLFVLYSLLNRAQIEAKKPKQYTAILSVINQGNREQISQLSLLYVSNGFTGAFAVQSLLSYYYQMRFKLSFQDVGIILFICCLLSALSSILSGRIIKRLGALNTITYSVLSFNVSLILIGMFWHTTICTILLLLRYLTFQLFTPAHDALTCKLVPTEQRQSINVITSVAFSIGLCLGLSLTSLSIVAFTWAILNFSFIVSGLLNIFMVFRYLRKGGHVVQKFEVIEQQEVEQGSDRL